MSPRASPTHPALTAVGSAIARRRRSALTRQIDVAAYCDFDRVFISYVENGKRNPSLLALVCIAEALDCKLSDILADAGY